jgi:hypothetical protein
MAKVQFLYLMTIQIAVSAYHVILCVVKGLQSIYIDVSDFVLNLIKFLEDTAERDEIMTVLMILNEIVGIYKCDLPLNTIFRSLLVVLTDINSDFQMTFFCLSGLIDVIGTRFLYLSHISLNLCILASKINQCYYACNVYDSLNKCVLYMKSKVNYSILQLILQSINSQF